MDSFAIQSRQSLEWGRTAAKAEVLPVAADMRPDFGQSGHWPEAHHRAAIRRIPAIQP
jgi:hypothetical protein